MGIFRAFSIKEFFILSFKKQVNAILRKSKMAKEICLMRKAAAKQDPNKKLNLDTG